jgi:hypothetical protein
MGVVRSGAALSLRGLFLFLSFSTFTGAGLVKAANWTEGQKARALKRSQNIPTNFFWGLFAEQRIESLAKFPCIEVYANLLEANKRAFQVLSDGKYRWWQKDHPEEARMTIYWITDALEKIATENEVRQLDAFYDSSIASINSRWPVTASFIRRYWKAARKKIVARQRELPSISGLDKDTVLKQIAEDKAQENWPEETKAEKRRKIGDKISLAQKEKLTGLGVDLTDFDLWMRERVKEQDESIEAINAIEDRFSLYGTQETVSEVILLTGLPGGGKDTTAENWVDGVYGYEGASDEHLHPLDAASKTAEAWSLLGSSTGYKGSSSLSPYIHYLVEHSCGKYLIKTPSGRFRGASRIRHRQSRMER